MSICNRNCKMRRQQNVLSMWSSSAIFGWMSSSKLDRCAKRAGGRLSLEQDQINTEHNGIIEMNEKIVINPIKPDSIFSAWLTRTIHEVVINKKPRNFKRINENRLANKRNSSIQKFKIRTSRTNLVIDTFDWNTSRSNSRKQFTDKMWKIV